MPSCHRACRHSTPKRCRSSEPHPEPDGVVPDNGHRQGHAPCLTITFKCLTSYFIYGWARGRPLPSAFLRSVCWQQSADGNEARACATLSSHPLRRLPTRWLIGLVGCLHRRADRRATGSLGSLFASHAGRSAELLGHG